MDQQEITQQLSSLHKKVDMLTTMVSDLMETIHGRQSDSAAQREQVMRQIRNSQKMMMSFPGVKDNPAAQEVLKGILSVADSVGATGGCGGSK